jgi:hypothetical protein
MPESEAIRLAPQKNAAGIPFHPGSQTNELRNL